MLDERSRLARDLHDVVAHHVSLIAVRAETAPYTYPDLSADARLILSEIATDSRTALDELRGVLGILRRLRRRRPTYAAALRDPTSAAWCSRRSQATDVVSASLQGLETVQPTPGYVAYRVVQEALTNARRHAPGAPVDVTAHGDGAGGIRVLVTNRVSEQGDAEPGRGLTGMAERVAAVGGRARDRGARGRVRGGSASACRAPRRCGSNFVRVVVADDQPIICAGFAALLDAQADIEVVGTAADGEQLLALVAAEQPDVALVDVRMPVMDGIEATRLIAERHATRVLILTTFDLDQYVFDAIRAGASGFLLKDVTGDRLVEAVRMVGEGSMLLGPGVTRRLVEDFGVRGATEPDPVAHGLTARELEVLLLLGRGWSNAEIAQSLVVATETVKSHVAEVLRKLVLRDRVQAVVWCYENGLVQPGR